MKSLHRQGIRIAVSTVLGLGLALGSGVVQADDDDDTSAAGAKTEASAPAAETKTEASAPAASGGRESLAEKATNPTALLMQLRLQDSYNPSMRNANGYSNAGLFQAVFPTALGWGSSAEAIITRVTVPYVTTPKIPGGGHATGVGDSVINAFFITKWLPKGEMLVWGPTITIPTAGDNDLTGGGTWQAGPTVAYVNTKTKSIQWGFLLYQQWSFSKIRPTAQDVSVLNIQPIFTKHFSGGWYIGTPDAPNSYDFKNKRWKLNLGGVLGRVTKWGTRNVQIFGGVYFNPVTYTNVPTSRMTIKLNISFLYPE